MVFFLTGCFGPSKEDKEFTKEISELSILIDELYTDNQKDINSEADNETVKEIEQFFNDKSDLEKSEENEKLYITEENRYMEYLELKELEDKIRDTLTIQELTKADIESLKAELLLYENEFTLFYDRQSNTLVEAENDIEEENNKVEEVKLAIQKLINENGEAKEDLTEEDAENIKKLIDNLQPGDQRKKLEKEYQKIQNQMKENKEKEIKVSEKTGTYYVSETSTLNVRAGDSTNFPVIFSLNNGDKVEVTGKTDKGWYQVEVEGKEGYATSSYLSDKKENETEKAVVNNDTNPPNNKNTSNKINKPTNKGQNTNKKPTNDNKDNTSSNNGNNNSNNQNIVDKMKNLGTSRQVILVTTNGMNSYQGKVRTFEKNSNGKWNERLNATAYVGKNGFSNNKREGDMRTPTGKYTIGHAFGHGSKPNTKLSFKQATANDVWVDDSSSKYYNIWQKKDSESKDWNSAEAMNHELYKHGFVINYNTGQTPGAGSAIFMHVARPGTGYTSGCVATGEGNLLNIMSWIDPAKNPVIIQDVESNLSRY